MCSSDLRSLSSVRFADGTTWSVEELESRVDRRILGTDGDDVLNGHLWDDVFVGGKGDDVLRGGYGRDTYLWSPGDGNDVIEEETGWGTNMNRIEFGAGVETKDVHLRRSGNDLVVMYRETGETLTLRSWFYNPKMFEMAFASGEVWSSATIRDNVD